MSFLIDTSAWIEFFKPRGHPQVKRRVAAALAEGLVVTASPVVVELLAGLDERLPAHAAAVERIRAMELLDASWEACAAAAGVARALNRRGQRVPTVDLMIAGIVRARDCEIWHAGDRHFALIERAGGPRQRDVSD